MKISGSTSFSGQKIDDDLISSGSVRLQGNFECIGLRSSGAFRGGGDLTVHGDIRSSGAFRLASNLIGDGNAKFSGSTRVGGALTIRGALSNSGSLRVGGKVECQEGVRFTGSSRVHGSVSSQKTIVIDGTARIEGGIKGGEVYIGHERLFSRKLLRQPYKVGGSILAKENVELIGTYVGGDVRGTDVKIGIGTEISGTVYYVNNIEIHNKAKINHGPIQITMNDLPNLK